MSNGYEEHTSVTQNAWFLFSIIKFYQYLFSQSAQFSHCIFQLSLSDRTGCL